MEMPKSRAKAGSRPIIRNSVVTIRKAETARMVILSVELSAVEASGRGDSIALMTPLFSKGGTMVLVL
jgi:hypothetical protein